MSIFEIAFLILTFYFNYIFIKNDIILTHFYHQHITLRVVASRGVAFVTFF